MNATVAPSLTNLDKELCDVAAGNIEAAREMGEREAIVHRHNMCHTVTTVQHNTSHEAWNV